jgi:hypothetical protein
MTNKPISRRANIVVQELKNEVLIYDLEINKAYCLNQTTALVWQCCDGKTTPLQISNILSIKLKTLFSEDLVWLTLNELQKNGLLDESQIVPNKFSALSRREAVRKIGFASLVALPIITSLVAPTAINAATCSLVQPGQPFAVTTRPATCADGTCPAICSTRSNLCCTNTIRSVVCTDLGVIPPTIQCDCTCD